MSKTLIIATVAVMVVAVVLLGTSLFIPGGTKPTSAPADNSQSAQDSQTVSPTVTAAPVPIGTFRGTVASISAVSISVKGEFDTKTFSLSANLNVVRLTSGTLERGDAKTEQANASSLTIGQEVLVMSDKDGQNARAVVIIK